MTCLPPHRQTGPAQQHGFTAVKHQREVGTGYFDLVSTALNPASHGKTSSPSATRRTVLAAAINEWV
ncbi:hypothetical protein [Streptomyces sp. NEAU-S77]|uniref:hypothetical protein n=1 Tax=Streptomyces sp. NEAU-S77 TaxID=3411033 RepID=UPI003B9F5C69